MSGQVQLQGHWQPPLPPGSLPPIPPMPPTQSAASDSNPQGSTTPTSNMIFGMNNALGISTSSAPKIKKLNDSNWLAWNTHITTILRRKEVYKIAISAVPQPQDSHAAATWRKQDLDAQELITTTIQDKQVINISECTTLADMWESLCTIHEPRGQQSILSTKCVLYSTQAKEDSDIATHLGYMKILHEYLGHCVDHNQFKAILVTLLPESWESFTTSYLGYQGGSQGNQHTQVMTVQQLVSLLIEEVK